MQPASAKSPIARPETEERASIRAWHRFYHAHIAPRFRRRRMALFASTMAVDDATRIIDLGGVPETWRMLAASPRVTIVNMRGRPFADERLRTVIGDACAVREADDSYDIAFSNAVIAHAGDEARHQAFADEIRRLAPRYFVQTPYRYFPVEPHVMTLGIHFLPRTCFKALVRWFSLWGLVTRPSRAEIDEAVDEIRSLTVPQMRALFPDAMIVRERFLFLTKSLIAVKR